MKVVIDCNVFVICLTSRSPYHHIYQALINGKFQLAVTTDILLEYQEIIERKYGATTANALIALLHQLPNVYLVTTYYRWQLMISDPDDNKYCDCAVATQADYIVTEDSHFDILQTVTFPALSSISVDTFSALL